MDISYNGTDFATVVYKNKNTGSIATEIMLKGQFRYAIQKDIIKDDVLFEDYLKSICWEKIL